MAIQSFLVLLLRIFDKDFHPVHSFESILDHLHQRGRILLKVLCFLFLEKMDTLVLSDNYELQKSIKNSLPKDLITKLVEPLPENLKPLLFLISLSHLPAFFKNLQSTRRRLIVFKRGSYFLSLYTRTLH